MPSRLITLPSRGPLGNAVQGNIGSDSYYAVLVQKAFQVMGLEYQPWWVPSDYDLSRRSTLTLIVEPSTAEATTTKDVLWRFQQTLIEADGTQVDWSFDTLMHVPANWVDVLYWPIENPNDGLSFFEPHWLDRVRTLGMRIQRRGQDSADTYPGNVRLGGTLLLDYPLRCQKACCP